MGKANAKENPEASKYNNNTTSLQRQKKRKKENLMHKSNIGQHKKIKIHKRSLQDL